jgi:hypothetical protein
LRRPRVCWWAVRRGNAPSVLQAAVMAAAATPSEDQLSGATGDERRRRRRFAAQLVPVCVVLLVVGALWADKDGALGAVATAALAQGIGLAVALAWLSVGHNPLDRR